MHAKALSLLAGVGALFIAGTTSAQVHPEFSHIEILDFTDFFTSSHPSAAVQAAYASTNLATFRVFAVFNAAAIVRKHGGPGTFHDYKAWANSIPSGEFWNHTDGPDHYNLAPTGSQIIANPHHAFDSFMTIGKFVNSNAEAIPSDSLLAAESGNFQNNFELTDSGVVLPPAYLAEGLASQFVQGVKNDGLYRVLLYQFTIAKGIVELTGNSGIEGNVGMLAGFDSDGVAFDVFETGNGELAYGIMLPAPGALGLLALAGIVGARRRRE